MLEKITSIDSIEVSKDSHVHVYTKVVILENGEQLSSQIIKRTIWPGECSASDDDRVKAVCASVHTPEFVAAYNAQQAEFAQGTKIPA
jgi:hypothetical protein